MKILVSGSSGLIGSNVVKVMGDLYGDEVIVRPVDPLDPDALTSQVAAHRPDAIVHCAVPDGWTRLLADRLSAATGKADEDAMRDGLRRAADALRGGCESAGLAP